MAAQAEWGGVADRALEVFERFGPYVFLVAAVVWLLRAWFVRDRYRVDAVMTDSVQSRVHTELVEAERRTVGEIVPVVLERSDRHADGEWLSGLVMLVIGTAFLHAALPWEFPWLVLPAQLSLGAIGFFLARALPAWKRGFVSEARADEVASEQALQEFQRLDLAHTSGRTGVLLFVSLFERRVVVLGDSGIHACVGEAHWQKTRDVVLAGISRGSLADGLVEGVRACGDVLACHFPSADGARNEVPDRLIVRRE